VTVVLSGAGGIIFVLWDFEVNFCSTISFIIVHVFSMRSANVWLTVPIEVLNNLNNHFQLLFRDW
jgi:hypothetical protein